MSHDQTTSVVLTHHGNMIGYDGGSRGARMLLLVMLGVVSHIFTPVNIANTTYEIRSSTWTLIAAEDVRS